MEDGVLVMYSRVIQCKYASFMFNQESSEKQLKTQRQSQAQYSDALLISLLNTDGARNTLKQVYEDSYTNIKAF
jgi:hypothetical protein